MSRPTIDAVIDYVDWLCAIIEEGTLLRRDGDRAAWIQTRDEGREARVELEAMIRALAEPEPAGPRVPDAEEDKEGMDTPLKIALSDLRAAQAEIRQLLHERGYACENPCGDCCGCNFARDASQGGVNDV